MTAQIGTDISREGNPFRVYPVARLQTDDEVLSWTVPTPSIELVAGEIEKFSKYFREWNPAVPKPASLGPEGGGSPDSRKDDIEKVAAYFAKWQQAAPKPASLVLGVSGPPGSGKTHLLLFTRGKLDRTLPLGTTLQLRSAELPWEQFYTDVCAPNLRTLDLPRLFTKLIAREASVVALALPVTAGHALTLETQPGKVFELLRSGDLSRTDVERRYRTAIAALAPGGSPDLHAVLASLHLRELVKPALDWLGGKAVAVADLQRLGAGGPMNLFDDAIPAIAAIAGLCWRLGLVFMLCIDEMERLTKWDLAAQAEMGQVPKLRNSEWLRRLAEGVAGQGGVLVFAGQPQAWDQPADVLDRLASRLLIELIAWDAEKIEELVRSAGTGWVARWREGAFGALARQTHGNIRQIQTVLFALFNETARDKEKFVTVDAVRDAAAKHLRQAAPRPDLLAPVVRAAESAGGTVEANAAPLEGLVFDLLVRKEGVPHLAIRRITVGDEGELVRSGIETNQHLNRLKLDKGLTLHALLIVQGATDPELLATLGHYSAIATVDGEAPDAEEQVRRATLQRMAEPAVPVGDRKAAPQADEDRMVTARAIDVAERVGQARAALGSNLAERYPELSRPGGALAQAGLDFESAQADLEQLERARIVEHFSQEAAATPSLMEFVIRGLMGPQILAGAMMAILFVASPLLLAYYSKYDVVDPRLYDVWINLSPTLAVLTLIVTIFASSVRAVRERDKARNARRTAFNVIHELLLRGVSTAELASARTRLDALLFRNDATAEDFEKIVRARAELKG